MAKHKWGLLTIGVAAAALTSLLTITPATADGPQGGEVVFEQHAPMNIVGYDAGIAAANGFEIVTDENGVQTSVPVTDEAKAIVAEYEGGPQARNTVWGDCGSASLFITRLGIYTIVIETAYSAYLPSVSHVWDVDGAVTSGTYSEAFSGLNFSNTWYAAHNVGVNNNTSGFGVVRSGSRAYLIDGAICYAYGPSDSW